MPRRKEVDTWFAKYQTPTKDVVQKVREIGLAASACRKTSCASTPPVRVEAQTSTAGCLKMPL
jgi:hypothetical protein